MSSDSAIPTGAATITQRDIADRLGVSYATISLALRDHPRIPVATRERIKRIADEIGYRPRSGVRILSDHVRAKRPPSKRPPLGWINAWTQPDKLARHLEYGGYWKGACEAASEMGFHLEEFRLHPGITLKELKRELRAKGYRGLLLPPEGDPAVLSRFPWENYHVVSLSHFTSTPSTNLVGPDRVGNCSIAFNRMRDRGYHRIGFLTDRLPKTINDKLSVAGFLSTQCELPKEEHLPVFTTTDSALPSQLSEWVVRHRLDAILTDLSDAALILKKAGLQVPQDLGLAFSCRSRTRGSAGIDCHPEEVGRLGVEMLGRAIGGYLKDTPCIRVAVNGHWRDGRTLPVVLKEG